MELKFANGMSEDEKKVEGTEGVEQPLKNGKKSGSEKKIAEQNEEEKPKTLQPFMTKYTKKTNNEKDCEVIHPSETIYTEKSDNEEYSEMIKPFTTEYTEKPDNEKNPEMIQPFLTMYTDSVNTSSAGADLNVLDVGKCEVPDLENLKEGQLPSYETEAEDWKCRSEKWNAREHPAPNGPGDISNPGDLEVVQSGLQHSKDSGEEKKTECGLQAEENPQATGKTDVAKMKIEPVGFASEKIAWIVERFMGDLSDCPGFAPFLANAILAYEKAGGDVSGIISTKKNKSKKEGLNFTLELKRCISNIYDTENGEEAVREYSVMINVFTKMGREKRYHVRIEADKIKDPNWLKKATDSMATDPVAMGKKAQFQTLVQGCIEKTDDVPHEIIYQNAGWRNVHKLGWRYVCGEGAVGEKTDLVHTASQRYRLAIDQSRLGSKEIFQNMIGMMDICKTRAASTELLLFVHTAMLATLFEKAGHKISFLFGINGVTNSRKTSMTLAIAKVFGRDEPSGLKADAQFAIATRGGIESTLGMYKDAPILIDDFKPGSNRQEQREMDRKLDELARFYGDGVEKKRMTEFLPDKIKKFFPIYGGCVLTMEIVTGVLSSISRMFITEISVDEVDNERLKFYQKNLLILPTHLYDFLSWVTERFDETVEYISDRFEKFRGEYKFEVARYGSMYSTFKVTALLISEYAVGKGFWDRKEQESFIRSVERMITKELFAMGSRLKNCDKGTLLLKAIEEMLQNTMLTFYSLSPENCANGETCYEDGSFYYIQSKILMQIAQNFCMKYNERDQIVNQNELISLLEKLGILDIRETDGKRERSRKLPNPKGNTRRYLYIKKGRLKKLLDQLE